jgi:hypothetical protein
VIKGNRGQLTIFMGITLIIMMGMLAFIINVGLFVKAKINLQNAVDAAAFSGAATQARQLTNIAYVNWELRNTFKEWMFKYYIMGQLGLFPSTANNLSNTSGNGKMDFRLQVPNVLQFNAGTQYNSVALDAYNVPTICIHNNKSKNICPLYMIPGLPRFDAIGVAGITEIHEALVNKLVTEKSNDCSARTQINFLAALSWTYSSGISEVPGVPLVATSRAGAWPQALEIAMRIRNLEMIVNRPPITDGITRSNVTSLPDASPDMALNERPYKAFMSAYKNLSGGKYKDNATDELAGNFKLYELAPTQYTVGAQSASGFLIPSGFSYSGGGSALNKSYLDLQIVPLNYAIMYSTFTSTKYKYEGVDAEGACGISKTALPVPGYIMGFTKNPEVLTYYAVKGESKFIGLFYPFDSKRDGITLTAYAAAKPFGGRIGPKLFGFSGNSESIIAREDKDRKSKPYFNGLVAPTTGSAFKTGFPIPYLQDFWASNAKANYVLGGIPGRSAAPSFGIPNMLYDFESEADLARQSTSTQLIQDIDYNIIGGSTNKESLGLYDKAQFRFLKESLTGNPSPDDSLSTSQINNAIFKSRRPTKYEAINYLIPDYASVSAGNTAAPYIIPLSTVDGTSPNNTTYLYKLFAPLQGATTLYKTNDEVLTVINSYMAANDQAVKTYLKTLLEVSNSIANTKTGNDTSNLLLESAKSIHINAGSNNEIPNFLSDGSCAVDIASKFNHFFRASSTACGIVPISTMMVDYVNKHSNTADGSNRYLVSTFWAGPGRLSPDQFMTGYFPGKRQGNDENGMNVHPLGLTGADYPAFSGKRNFYSTKFVQMAKLMDSPPNTGGTTTGKSDYESQPALCESVDGNLGKCDIPADLQKDGVTIKNPLKYQDPLLNNNYYLDF